MSSIRQKVWRFLGVGLLTLCLLAIGFGPAFAALKDLGPVDVTNGFPVWYRDTSTNNAITIPPNPEQTFPQGLPLQICLSQTLSPVGGGAFMCNLLPGTGFIPENPIIFPSNFPDEAFWFAAESAFTGTGDIGDALLVIGLEAAFAGGGVVPGDQISFARVRIRIDVNTPGTYRVTHPYGVEIFPDVPAGVRTINFTSDIGIGAAGDFTGALSGAIGPFVTWDGPDFPVIVGDEAFIGDPNVPHTITGSPFGTNVFRVERIDAQGNALSSQQQTLFSVTGKIYTTPIASPLKVNRASYARNDIFARINVFAEADVISNSPPALSSLEVSGANIPTTVMDTDGNGHFFANIEGLSPADIPASVTVTNIGDVPPKVVEVEVVDEVTITAATYDVDTSTMHIEASSSDELVPPTLITEFGTLTNGVLDVAAIVAPQSTVSVSSSAGGVDSEPVIVPLPAPVSNVTLTSNPTSPQIVGIAQVDFTALAEGGSGDYEYQFWLKQPGGEWAVAQNYSAQSTWTWDTSAMAAGTYNVSVYARNAGETVSFEAFKVVNFIIAPSAATSVSLVPNVPSPQNAGPVVTFTASGTGGIGVYEYQFWFKPPNGNWTIVQNYSTQNSWAWNTTGLTPGAYGVSVYARNAGSTTNVEAFNVRSFQISPIAATGALLGADLSSPRAPGATVNFLAAGVGGSGTYEYQFWLRNPAGVWSVTQNYSSTNSWAWNTTGLATGSYTISVYVRSQGSTSLVEAFKPMSFVLQ